MPKFSEKSMNQLKTCHIDLQTLFLEVIKHIDCKVTEGYRNEEDQNKAFDNGFSQKRYPNGEHNQFPSKAVDVYIYPIEMKNTKRFYWFAGFVLGMAKMLLLQGKITHEIRWGGDWDMDNDLDDQTFNDLVHFQVVL